MGGVTDPSLSCNIQELPAELQTAILAFLSIPDVLFMRQTNKLYYTLSYDRALWLNHLKLQCLQNDVPLLTYDFNAMSQADLEESACRCLKSEARLESEDAWYREIRQLNMNVEDEISSSITALEVIPGGRFLITGNDVGTLRCWDLWNQQDRDAMVPCAEYFFGSHILGKWVQRSVESPSKITIGVKLWSLETMASMYVIQLDLETMRFEVAGKTVFVSWYLLWMMDGDIVAAVDEEINVYIWNWRKNLWMYLVTNISPIGTHSRLGLLNILVTHQYVVIFHISSQQGGVTYTVLEHGACWSGPEARTMQPTWELAQQNRIEKDILVYSRQLSTDGLDIDFALNWRPTSMRPINSAAGTFMSAPIADSVVATYPSATHMIPFEFKSRRIFSSDNSGETTQSDGQEPGDVPSLAAEPIPILFVDKKDPTDHLPIFPGFRSNHICWLNENDEWMIVQRRHDGKIINGSKVPRRLGDVQSECSRLVLSIMSGSAFFALERGPSGTVMMWEYLERGD